MPPLGTKIENSIWGGGVWKLTHESINDPQLEIAKQKHI